MLEDQVAETSQTTTYGRPFCASPSPRFAKMTKRSRLMQDVHLLGAKGRTKISIEPYIKRHRYT